MEKNKGFVLKIFDTGWLSVLDSQLGRIECKLVRRKTPYIVNNGALVHYIISKNRKLFQLDALELQHIPFFLASQDIYFFHHILELSYYFLPLEYPHDDIFELLVYLFCNSAGLTLTGFQKKILLSKFFAYLGLFSEDVYDQNAFFKRLISQPIESILNECFDERIQKLIEHWILGCIALHPHRNQFKTIYFMGKKGVL